MKKYIFLPLFIAFVVVSYYFSETSIHIIRHGEKVITKGVSDAPLTERGILQAREVGERSAKSLPQVSSQDNGRPPDVERCH